MITKQTVRRWKTSRRICIWALVMILALGEAWFMGKFYGTFGNSNPAPAPAQGPSAPDLLLSLR